MYVTSPAFEARGHKLAICMVLLEHLQSVEERELPHGRQTTTGPMQLWLKQE